MWAVHDSVNAPSLRTSSSLREPPAGEGSRAPVKRGWIRHAGEALGAAASAAALRADSRRLRITLLCRRHSYVQDTFRYYIECARHLVTLYRACNTLFDTI